GALGHGEVPDRERDGAGSGALIAGHGVDAGVLAGGSRARDQKVNPDGLVVGGLEIEGTAVNWAPGSGLPVAGWVKGVNPSAYQPGDMGWLEPFQFGLDLFTWTYFSR